MGCVPQQHPAIDIPLAVADPDALSGGRDFTSRRDSTIDWCASRWIRYPVSAIGGLSQHGDGVPVGSRGIAT